MPSPRAVELLLSDGERVQLEAWARRRKSAQALAQRSRIVLAAAEGWKNTEIAERLGQQTWKLSRDPQFVAKVRDVVGLYLNPPERAVVLCVDVKSQIQALDRTAPVLPMLPGTPQRATHDYKRFGTSSLYAALDLGSGKVISSLHARHRAIEFKKFLQRLHHEVPSEQEGPLS